MTRIPKECCRAASTALPCVLRAQGEILAERNMMRRGSPGM